jgi:integrase
VPSFKDLIDTHLEARRDLTITFSEFRSLLNACDNEEKGGLGRKHLKLFLVGLHQLACRTEELQKIRRKDIDLDTRIVKVWEGKRKVPAQRDAYISDRLLTALIENDVMSLPPDARAFGNTDSYKRSFKTAKKLAGVREDFRINDLRRTGITNMVQSGMSLPAIQKQVGHKANSAMTLDIYTKLSPDYIVKEHQKVESFYDSEEAKMHGANASQMSEAVN